MPRKQNGWGNTRSFSVNSVNNRTDKSKGVQGSGQYPSDRRFGSTVTRSVVQQWNLDSTWMMWRKGYEYARRNIWVNLDVLFFAFLFSGTTSRLRANFKCKRFPALKNDTATRYVVKREIASSITDPRYATVTAILNDPNQYKKNFQNEEIWLQVTPDADPEKGDVIKRLVHERITNKRHGTEYTTNKTFEATVKTVLTSDEKPMVYTATSHKKEMFLTARIPREDVLSAPYVVENGLYSLEGQVIRMTNLPIGMDKQGLTFIDEPDDVKVEMQSTMTNMDFWIANVNDQTPFEVFVDTSPLIILSGSNATFIMDNEFNIAKSQYQKYFEGYLTADTIDNETDQMSAVIAPLYISQVSDDGTDIIIQTIPFEPQLMLYANDTSAYIVLSDFSFTSWQLQENGDTFNDTSIYPWQDQTWLVGDGIYVADAYACNCQSFSHSTVTSPEALYRRYTGAALNKNRQLKYPLPSALSNKDIEGLSNAESGFIVNWATRRNRLEHKTCKHSIASIFAEETIAIGLAGFIDADTGLIMSVNSVGEFVGLSVGDPLPPATDDLSGVFVIAQVEGNNISVDPGTLYKAGDKCVCIDETKGWVRQVQSDSSVPGTGGVFIGTNKGYKVLEPNTFPAYAERLEVEQNISENAKSINFGESGPRAEISPVDFAFATLQLLNLMDTEVGSILGGNVALIPVTTARTMEEGIITD